MMMFTLSGFDHKSFLEKSGPKIQTCLFKVKVDTKTNSNMQNSMWCLFYVLDWKQLPLKIGT